jgi:hypothetical protein
MKRIYPADSIGATHEGVDETIQRLDELRSDFFIDLSHQLRTPVTAMKLAMDGLFSQLRDVLDPSQQNLAQISRRNIERVVALIENQLDLLQMMSGERQVCRQLTDLGEILDALPSRTFDAPFAIACGSDHGEITVVRAEGCPAGVPLHAFTDPKYLLAVADCMLGAVSANSRRSIRIEYDDVRREYRLEFRVDHLPEPAVHTGHPASRPVSALDFETRAYRAMVDRLGGKLTMEKDEDHKRALIVLPRYPSFERNKDILDPGRRIRESSGKPGGRGDGESSTLHMVRCDMGEKAGEDFVASAHGPVRELLGRISTVLSRGDAVLRGEQHGTIYLALVGRSGSELDHAVSFLAGNGGSDGDPTVWPPRIELEDTNEYDPAVCDLEPV